MFTVGQRVNREYMLMGQMYDRIGNVTYVDKTARVAHVVFDNHKESTPALCTFESLKSAESVKDVPAHEDYATLEHFQNLKDAEKGIGIYDRGESVALLLSDRDSIRVVYGKIYGTVYNPQTGIKYHVIERDGSKHVGNDNTAVVRI